MLSDEKSEPIAEPKKKREIPPHQKEVIKKIAENAIIAALYCSVTIIAAPISYMGIQFRIAEILVLLCFWRPDYILGLTLGCFIANIFSTLGPWDMLFGTGATLVTCILVSYASPKLFVAAIYPIVINAFVVGAELYFLCGLGFWEQTGLVALGEATVIIVSYFVWMGIAKNKSFMKILNPTRHQAVLY